MTAIKERIEWADFAKGLGILLVVFGHLSIPNFLLKFVFAFHMPLFIFISGMFFKQQKVFKNIKKLLICYVSMSLITSAVYAIFNQHAISWFFKNILNILLGGSAPNFRMDSAAALWFFTALIVIELAAYLKSKIQNKFTAVKYIFSPICIIIAFISAKLELYNYIPYNIIPALFLFPFYDLGTIINTSPKAKEHIKKVQSNNIFINILLCLFFALLTFVISYFNDMINIYRSAFGKSIILYYIGSITGCVFIILFSMMMSKCVFFFMKYLKWLGKNTVITMSIHQIMIMNLSVLNGKINIHPYIFEMIKLILIMILCSTITVIVNKYCPWLIAIKNKN